MWAETPNPNAVCMKLPPSRRAVSIPDIELKFYFDIWSVPELNFLRCRRWLIPTVKKQLQNSCFHFQKTDLTQRPFKHLPSPLQPPFPHLPIFFTDRNKRVFADLMHLQQQMLQWVICTRASLGSHNLDLLWFYSTGLLALARTHEPVSRLYTFTVLRVQKGFFLHKKVVIGPFRIRNPTILRFNFYPKKICGSQNPADFAKSHSGFAYVCVGFKLKLFLALELPAERLNRGLVCMLKARTGVVARTRTANWRCIFSWVNWNPALPCPGDVDCR